MDDTAQFELIPGSHRVTDRVANLLRRVPVMAWPFIVLAVLRWVGAFYTSLGRGWDEWTLVSLAGASALAVLPAAVLIGRPDAWRSARTVLVGAIAWSTISATAAVVWSLPGISDTSSGTLRLSVALVGQLAALAAPVLIMVGLSARRRTSTTWPILIVALTLVGTVLSLVYVGSNAWSYYNQPFINQGFLVGEIRLATQMLIPLSLLTIGALAWSSMSALRAGESPRRFWSALTAGSIALWAIYVYSIASAFVFETVGYTRGTYDLLVNLSHVQNCVYLVAVVLLAVAFGLGLPNAIESEVQPDQVEPDADSEGPAEPADLPA